MKERIQKVLATAGIASRRAVEEMVLQGRVAVNGRTVARLPVLVDPVEDRIEVDGELVAGLYQREAPKVYLLLNKPRGVYCTNVAQGEQKRAIDLLPSDFPYRVYPVGRLDAESRGLILLTNDGELTHRLTHPRFGVPKTYRAVVDGSIDAGAVDTMRRGVWLADPDKGGFKTGRSGIRIVDRTRQRSTIEITIREGRNRQVRRMLANVGYRVRDLVRIRIGSLGIDGLAPGKYRSLTTAEVRRLRETAAQPKGEAPTGRKTADGKPAGKPPARRRASPTRPASDTRSA